MNSHLDGRKTPIPYVLGPLLLCCYAVWQASGFAFCSKFASIDLGKSFFSFAFAVAEFTALYTICVAKFLLRHKIDDIFEGLSTIYKTGKFPIRIDVMKSKFLSIQYWWKFFCIFSLFFFEFS